MRSNSVRSVRGFGLQSYIGSNGGTWSTTRMEEDGMRGVIPSEEGRLHEPQISQSCAVNQFPISMASRRFRW